MKDSSTRFSNSNVSTNLSQNLNRLLQRNSASNPNTDRKIMVKSTTLKVLPKTSIIHNRITRRGETVNYIPMDLLALTPELHGQNCHSFFPEWLASRQDFRELGIENHSDISRILLKPQHLRNESEKEAVYSWSKTVEFYKYMPASISRELCDIMVCFLYKKNDLIFSKGSSPDYAYIVYCGSVGIYNNHERINNCDEGGHFGELAIENNTLRFADAIADEASILFAIKDIDYRRIVINFKSLEKHSAFKTISSISFLTGISYGKLQSFINNFVTTVVQEDKILYDVGDNSHSFYVVKSGKVDLQTIAEIEKKNKWPVGLHEWSVKKINKKYAHTFKSFKAGEFFGEFEIFCKNSRSTKAIAYKDSVLLIIAREKVEKILEYIPNYLVSNSISDYTHLIQESDKKFKNKILKSSLSYELLCKSISNSSKKSIRLRKDFKIRKAIEDEDLEKKVVKNEVKVKVKQFKSQKEYNIECEFRSKNSITVSPKNRIYKKDLNLGENRLSKLYSPALI